MAGYGEVAVEAVRLIHSDGVMPTSAWESAAKSILRTVDSRTKGCPKSAFLGLCAAGAIQNVPGGYYDGALETKNAQYAISAVKILRLTKDLLIDELVLWEKRLSLLVERLGPRTTNKWMLY